MLFNGTEIIVSTQVEYVFMGVPEIIMDADVLDGHIVYTSVNNLLSQRRVQDNMYMIAVKVLAKYSRLRLQKVLIRYPGTTAMAIKVQSLLELGSDSKSVSMHMKHHLPTVEYLSGAEDSKMRFVIGKNLAGHIRLGCGKNYHNRWRSFKKHRVIREALRIYLDNATDDEFLDVIECIIPRII